MPTLKEEAIEVPVYNMESALEVLQNAGICPHLLITFNPHKPGFVRLVTALQDDNLIDFRDPTARNVLTYDVAEKGFRRLPRTYSVQIRTMEMGHLERIAVAFGRAVEMIAVCFPSAEHVS